MTPDASYAISTEGQLMPHMRQEWLLTSGLGSFSLGTVVGCNIRRYSGLLCAATLPPVGRVMALSRLGEVLYLDGDTSTLLELSINQFRNHIHPRGDKHLRRFVFGDIARWEFDFGGVPVVKELQLLWQRNVVGIRYQVKAEPGRVWRLDLSPFTSLRDFHHLRQRGGVDFAVETTPRSVAVSGGGVTLHVRGDAGRFLRGDDWWYGHVFPIESERGQDDHEDLFTPGRFVIEGTGEGGVTLWASTDPIAELPDWDAELVRRRASSGVLGATDAHFTAPPAAPPVPDVPEPTPSVTVQRLFRAAADFIVKRKGPDGVDYATIIAGYPWFADWGRDTFISLPGLLLATGRFELAKRVLSVFGQHISQGMVPNRFDDYSNEPHYNTVDASLWYIHAAFEYLRLSRDQATFDEVLRPACRKIIDGYRDGTRFHIRMMEDGLITQGDWSTQLTWMDAKFGDTAFTPRQGKAVEINALWYHALVLMSETELAKKVKTSFQKAFWISPFRGLADVVEGDRQDRSIRPNQIFAASLANSPLDAEQQRAVVEVVRRELLTPYGLRTLARGEPRYQGRYGGAQPQRDEAYHNGTVWPWPIGAFLEAYLRVNNRSREATEQCRQWLRPLLDLMETGDRCCIGQISEIFEADEPHTPAGCPAQAWSVAEVLRLAVELGM